MSTIAAPPQAVPEQRGGEEDTLTERGRTVVPERVVAKIAGRAVSEVGGTRDLTGRLGGLVGGGSGPARAHVRLSGTHVTLRLVIAVRYPSPLRSTAREVRAHVKKRVEEHTGMTVQHIDIEIGELVRDRRAQ